MSKHQNAGYTLVELLVVTALLGIILLGVSTLFMQSLFASVRTNQRQELRAEGQYALDTMSYIIRNARSVLPCGAPNTPEPSDSLFVVGADGRETNFSLISSANGNVQIASTSALLVPSVSTFEARLTSDAVDISIPATGAFFTCATNVSQQPYVIIRFTASQANSLGADPLEQSFRHTVLVRNRVTN